ncbi:MAG: DUF4435 domain-containing protein [Syntrophus sp. (in: bacteria)]
MGSLEDYMFEKPERHVGENFVRRESITICVEGVDDEKFFLKFFHEKHCKVRSCKNKDGVLQALKSAQNKYNVHIIGIVDRDFDTVLNRTHPDKNIFCVDYHDVEIMMIETGDFLPIITENFFVSTTKNPINIVEKITQVKQNAYVMAYPIGCLRLINEIEKMQMSFSMIPWEKFVIFSQKLEPAINEAELIKLMSIKQISAELLQLKLRETMEKYQKDYRHICCGHDVAEAIVFMIKREVKNHSPIDAIKLKIQSLLRASYHKSEFSQTQLYATLVDYEKELRIHLFPVHMHSTAVNGQ